MSGCCHEPERGTYQLETSHSKPPFQHGYIKKMKVTKHCKIYSIYLCVGGMKTEVGDVPSCAHFHLLGFSSSLLVTAGNLVLKAVVFSQKLDLQDLSSASSLKEKLQPTAKDA